jgi:hypothetical protein
MSSIPQCYINLYPLNPIINKKKDIRLVSPARAKNRSILLRSKSILPFPTHEPPIRTSFCSPPPRTGTTSHFIHNPFHFAPTFRSYSFVPHSHLTPATSLAVPLSLLGLRLRQLAALKQLNKLRCDLPPSSGAGRKGVREARGLSPLYAVRGLPFKHARSA